MTGDQLRSFIAELEADIQTQDPNGPILFSPDTVTRILDALRAQLPNAVPPVPFDEIIAAYHKLLPTLAKVSKLTDQRRRQLARRWAEDETRQAVSWWMAYFLRASRSDFLMGHHSNGRSDWKADFDFFLQPKSMIKILEGAYGIENARVASQSDYLAGVRHEQQQRMQRGTR